MSWFIHFAYPWVLYGGLPLLAVAVWYRLGRYQPAQYLYPLTNSLKVKGVMESGWRQNVFALLRVVVLGGLILLIARPQRIDEHSKTLVEGIDIMLVLDVSGSMQLFDDPYHPKKRIDIAKEEAINFVKRRDNDPIGLVLFGKEAVSRCPLTLDKTVLESIIQEIELGVLNPEGTVLSKALITALNRLQKSSAHSKIIILLTDGEPTPGDIHPQEAIALAQKYDIKIYTIGIGGRYGGLIDNPVLGPQPVGIPLNTALLEMFANQTGGRAFVATNQAELQNIYNTIDSLEKTEYETDVYKNFNDIFMPFLWILCGLFMAELLIATLLWFHL